MKGRIIGDAKDTPQKIKNYESTTLPAQTDHR